MKDENYLNIQLSGVKTVLGKTHHSYILYFNLIISYILGLSHVDIISSMKSASLPLSLPSGIVKDNGINLTIYLYLLIFIYQ
jgi:hypothetical protein